MAEEMFKTTMMGGFDKDDVLAKVKNIKDEAYAEKSKLIKAGKEKDKKIKELQNQINQNNIQKAQEMEELREEHRRELKKMEKLLEVKNAQKEKLEWEISEKYQKYIDRYDPVSYTHLPVGTSIVLSINLDREEGEKGEISNNVGG